MASTDDQPTTSQTEGAPGAAGTDTPVNVTRLRTAAAMSRSVPASVPSA